MNSTVCLPKESNIRHDPFFAQTREGLKSLITQATEQKQFLQDKGTLIVSH